MKEKNLAITISLILIVLGLIISYFALISSQFNFYKSKLVISGNHVKETLYYNPNKPYHTLYRNFFSPIETSNFQTPNSILINSVDCEIGNPYFKIGYDCYLAPDFSIPKICPSYTEPNEYGCTFGNTLGFSLGKNYYISSEFTLSRFNLFRINGNYYFKFIAYSKNNHKLLTKNNFIINGNVVSKNYYLPNENVIIYIPYNGDTSGYNIINQQNFKFDSEILKDILLILVLISPGLILFLSWYFFGRELSYEDIPDQLSQYPNDRKAWEVAAYFNPPFAVIDQNFTSSMILDLYRRKIIDIKIQDKELYIKINNFDSRLIDDIEKSFIKTLKYLKEKAKDKHKLGEYFNLAKVSSYFTVKFSLKDYINVLQDDIKEEGKTYIKKTGVIFMTIFMTFMLFATVYFLGPVYNNVPFMIFYFIVAYFVISIINSKTALLTQHKKDYYIEYQKWQAFKKWLKDSPSMKESEPKAVVLWEQYLCYATALGVSKKVLKELKQEGIINQNQYNFYSGVYLGSTSFSTSSGFAGSSGGGGFGGAAGGGGGGGGGGGR